MQTPAPFEYERATSVDDAIAALGRHGSEARIVAGGHSLLPMMKLRLAKPSHLIDINGIADLPYIREDGREIRIGALTRHVDLLKSDLLARALPGLPRRREGDRRPGRAQPRDDRRIAVPGGRRRGPVGGLQRGEGEGRDPGADGERVVPMDDFHVGPYMTAVGDGEMLTEVRLDVRPGAGSAHEKVERRAGDWAIAAASAAVWMDDGIIRDVGIALSAVGLTTVHLTRAEELLRGKSPRDEVIAQVAEIASEDCSPMADGRGPVDYKRHLAGVLTQRALRRAMARANNQEA